MESASEAAERAASTAAGLHAVAEYEAEVGPIPVEADERARAALAAAGLPDDETQGPRFGSAPIPVPIWYHPQMAMTLRLTEEQTEALRRRAETEGRSMQQVALTAIDDYLLRAADDAETDEIAERGARRFADLLRRLAE
jgi:hypothetical protein